MYRDLAEQIRARRAKRKPDPAALLVPTIEDGADDAALAGREAETGRQRPPLRRGEDSLTGHAVPICGASRSQRQTGPSSGSTTAPTCTKPHFAGSRGVVACVLAGLENIPLVLLVVMDADLQHPPDVIPRLLEEWRRGKKIVHTVRIDNGDLPVFKKYSSQFFYRVFSFLSGVKIESGMSDFRLLDRQVVDHVVQFREVGLFLRGIVQWVGYPSSKVVFQARDRFTGSSKFTFRQMLRFASDGITSFSIIPLRICTVAGILTSTAAFGGIIYACYSKFVIGSAVPGWASEVSIISFLFGMLFIFLGLIGEYIGRIFVEVRGRPRFFVSDHIGINKRKGAKLKAQIPPVDAPRGNTSESR